MQTASMFDLPHQVTTCTNALASLSVTGTFESMHNAPVAVEAVLPANMHSLHHIIASPEVPAGLRVPDLAPQKVAAAASKVVEARTSERRPHTPPTLPSEVGRAAQPATIDVSRPQSLTSTSEMEQQQQLMMAMSGLNDGMIHHINWCGNAVFNRTSTSPAVSLCVTVAPPKKEYFDFEINLCTSVLLRNAYHLVDPVLFTSDVNIFNDCSATELQNAVTDSCHKSYNDRGRWSSDDWEADEDIPVLDTMVARDYGAEATILNGWSSGLNVPIRSDVVSHSARFAEQYHTARKPKTEEVSRKDGEGKYRRVVRQPFVTSPLREVVYCSEIYDIYFVATTTSAAAMRR